MATDNKPLVSVIMNCYNSSEYLREAIDSVFSQTYKNWEIIFWDNQSTDQSAEIFKSYSDERCKYFYAPEHTLLGEARNLAVAKAKGEWLAFLDCDDIWFPEKLIRQVEIINEEGSDLGLVYGKAEILVTEEGKQKSFGKKMKHHKSTNLPEGHIFSKLLLSNFIPFVSGLVRKEFFSNIGGINPSYKVAEDYDMFLKICFSSKVRALHQSCCAYRVHGNNITHSHRHLGYIESIQTICSFPLSLKSLIAITLNLFKYSLIRISGLISSKYK